MNNWSPFDDYVGPDERRGQPSPFSLRLLLVTGAVVMAGFAGAVVVAYVQRLAG